MRFNALLVGLIVTVVGGAAAPNPLRFQSGSERRLRDSALAKRLPDSLRKTLDSAAFKFFATWSWNWIQSQSTPLPRSLSKSGIPAHRVGYPRRGIHFHCHYNARVLNETAVILDPGYSAIRSALSAFSVCPSWPLDEDPVFPDEADGLDLALLPEFRERVRAARDTLLRLFNEALVIAPDDRFVVGQTVRFLFDQQLASDAFRVASTCSAERWWCSLLEGYAEYRMGRAAQAETAFANARDAMPVSERCIWDDIGLLLEDDARETFAVQECTARGLHNSRYWWLADPMWSVPGNDRKLEHDARNVHVQLQSAFRTDGRMHWSADSGGDARRRMIMRYGWPSYMGWAGTVADTGHGGWLQKWGSSPQPPYSTYEYSKGRVHTATTFAALQNPFSAEDTAWQLREPRNFSRRKHWWPVEFMKRDAPLAQLPRGQTAMLRRKGNLIFALATDIAPDDSVAVRSGTMATLLVSTGPESLQVVGSGPIRIGGLIFVRGRISSFPSLVGLEAHDVMSLLASGSRPSKDSVIAEARTRFAIVPPSTLEEMAPGEIAVSEPVLLRADGNGAPSPAMADSLLERMIGALTVNVRTTPRVGVYWETYGVRARDSVTIGLRVQRHSSIGGLRRLGIALRLADDPNSTVNITWREPEIGRVTSTVDAGGIPIQSRTLVLDLSRLEAGSYDIVMSVRRSKSTEATSVKRIVIVR